MKHPIFSDPLMKMASDGCTESKSSQELDELFDAFSDEVLKIEQHETFLIADSTLDDMRHVLIIAVNAQKKWAA